MLFGSDATNDSLAVGSPGRFIDGMVGNDVIRGSTGNDNLHGGLGDDTVTVAAGDDIIVSTYLRRSLVAAVDAKISERLFGSLTNQISKLLTRSADHKGPPS